MTKSFALFIALLVAFAASEIARRSTAETETVLASAPRAALSSSIMLTPLSGTVSSPVHVTNAHDGSNRLFVVEQAGRIRVYDAGGNLLATPFLDITSLVEYDGGERGLLSVAFHPDYASNGFFYVYYVNKLVSPGDITIARYSVSAGDPNVADPNSAVILLVIPHPTNTNHYGGQLFFGPGDGYLYAGTGDGGSGGDPPNNAQNLDKLLGKILRLDVDGSGAVPCGQASPAPYAIPSSNPFVGSGHCEEIWAYGVRNPWRYSFDRSTFDLLIGDVGQNCYEEIDFQSASSTGGENYGWRIMEGLHCYNTDGSCTPVSCNQAGLTLPILEESHGGGWCAIIGGYRYRGAAIAGLQESYLYSDNCLGDLYAATQDAGGDWSRSLLLSTGYSVSSFGEDEAGELYLTDLGGGKVYRIDAFVPTVTPTPSNTRTPTNTRTSTHTATPTVTRTPTATPNPNQPAVTGILPPSGPAAGGTAVTITGSNFIAGATVKIGGVPATGVSVTDSGHVAATVPAQTAGTLDDVAVTNPGPLTGILPKGWFADFLDVPPANLFHTDVEKIFRLGITAGCGDGTNYCVTNAVTRAQMAVFLLKAEHGSGYVPPACSGHFGDVVCPGPFTDWIEQLSNEGITAGCGGGNYCPDASVSRAQMAVFLLKTEHGSAYVPPACGGIFGDVACPSQYANWIEQLSAEGITAGCGGGNYCPSLAVLRGPMATFLTRTFGSAPAPAAPLPPTARGAAPRGAHSRD